MISTKHKRKTRRLSRREKEILAEMARRAALAKPPNLAVIGIEIEPKLKAEWERIKKTYSLPEIVDAVKAMEHGKGRPISAKTLAWIERIREEKLHGRGYLRLAQEFRPDLSKEQARGALRKFRSRWAHRIDH